MNEELQWVKGFCHSQCSPSSSSTGHFPAFRHGSHFVQKGDDNFNGADADLIMQNDNYHNCFLNKWEKKSAAWNRVIAIMKLQKSPLLLFITVYLSSMQPHLVFHCNLIASSEQLININSDKQPPMLKLYLPPVTVSTPPSPTQSGSFIHPLLQQK